jgi:hypothetical protein
MSEIATAPMLFPVRPPSRWQAAWIAPAGLDPAQQNVVFRARHRLGPCDRRGPVALYVAAESTYRLWVNGQVIGAGPVRGSRTVTCYDAYDIGPALRVDGENWLATEVACPAVATFKAAPVRAAVMAQVESADGSILAGSDATWQATVAPDHRADVPLYTVQQGFTEWRNLPAEPPGWRVGKGATWPAAVVVAPAEGLGGKRLLARDVPPLRETMVAPVAMPLVATVPPAPAEPPPADGQAVPNVAQPMSQEAHVPADLTLPAGGGPLVLPPAPGGGGVAIVLDFGRTLTGGGFQIDLDAPPGTVLDVGYGEHLIGGRVRTFIPNNQGNYSFADRFVLGSGRVIVEPTHERGFRVLQVVARGHAAPVTLWSCQATDRRHPAPPVATFECSDPTLNLVWGACVATIGACATDTFVDCPWREAAFWVNDLLVEQATWLRITGDAALPARCLRLAATERSGEGLVMGVCPSPGGRSLAFPATNFFMATMLAEHHAYTGDPTVVAEQIDALLRVFDAARGWEDAGGLIVVSPGVWNFVEWSYTFNAGGPRDLGSGRATAVLNWFYATGLRTTADLLLMLGRGDEAAGVAKRADAVAAAIDARLWSDALGAYAEWDGPDAPASQLPQAIALLSGLAPQHRREALAGAVTRGDLLAPELYLHHLVFRAMTATGQMSVALDRVRQHWGPIVASGSPTIWESNVHEHGAAAFGASGSLCHGFATGPIELFTGGVLGIVPLAPGFVRFAVRPQLGGLTHAAGTVSTPIGLIHVSCRSTAARIEVDLQVPPGTTAILPNGSALPPGRHGVHLTTACA